MRPRTTLTLTLLSLSIFLSFAPPARAQGFHSVFSRDGTDVWAVGDGGMMYRSLDGGASWTSRTLGDESLRDVAAVGYEVVAVSDSGKIWRSLDSGGSWALTVVPGAPRLNAIASPSALEWYVVGATGIILKSADGGVSWSAQSSGTASLLRAVRFTDPLNGWAVGDAGTVLRTIDGGASWTPVSVTSSATLFDVDVNGTSVWIVGAGGTARRSADGGASWQIVNLKLDARSDVRAVRLQTPSHVFLAGGGGFLRSSLDGGQTWVFPKHEMQAPISALWFAAGRAWACSDRNRIVLTSISQDDTWTMPAGTSVSRVWDQRLPSSVGIRGNTLCLNAQNPNAICVGLGNKIYRSLDEGETWVQTGTISVASYLNAFLMSPKDSNLMMVAIADAPKRIARSTNGGVTWTVTKQQTFGEYGIPLAMDPDHPDTVYFGPDSDKMYRSTDACSTWTAVSNISFTSPCNIVPVPDSANVILVGDGVTGSGNGKYYKSTDGGLTFTLATTAPAGASEIPGMACSRLRNATVFGTNWGAGGVQRSLNYGSTWPNVNNTISAWGVDIARDDPNCVIFGVYSGATTYLSFDGGDSYVATPITMGTNYSLLARDRATILAEQSNGIWKMHVTYAYTPNNAQSLSVVSPNGGEVWAAASSHDILWSPVNVAQARIEYRRSPADAWELVAVVPGYYGSYGWSVPKDATNQAKIRIRDAWDAVPEASSNATFTITVSPQLTVDPSPLDIATTPVGATTVGELTLANPGTGGVTISSVTSDNPRFWPGRTSFVIPAHTGDSLGIGYSPTVEGPDSAHVTIVSNDPGSPRVVLVTGSGMPPAAVGDPTASRFALWQNQPNPFTGSTRISYSLPVAAPVRLEVYNLLGQRVATLVAEVQGAGVHGATFVPGARTASGPPIGALAAGVYFYRFQAGAFTSTRKMLLMR